MGFETHLSLGQVQLPSWKALFSPLELEFANQDRLLYIEKLFCGVGAKIGREMRRV